MWWLAALGGGLLSVVLSDLVSEEVRARLDRLPRVLLRWARRRLPAELRERVHDQEWAPELDYILHRAEALPVTRLIAGTRYALGLAMRAAAIGDELLPHRQHGSPEQRHGIADRGLSVLRSAWPAPEPPWVRVYWAGIVAGAAAAISVAGVAATFRIGNAGTFLILVLAGRLIEPLGRPSNRPGPMAWTSFWFWSLPVAAVLPAVYGFVAPIPLTALRLWRYSHGVPPYRLVFSAACQGLACGCTSIVFHATIRAAPAHIGPGSYPFQWVIALILCSALGWAILESILMIAIKGANPDVMIRRMVAGRVLTRHDIPQICFGATIAFAFAVDPFIAITALPAATLLQRWIHHSCVCWPAEAGNSR